MMTKVMDGMMVPPWQTQQQYYSIMINLLTPRTRCAAQKFHRRSVFARLHELVQFHQVSQRPLIPDRDLKTGGRNFFQA